MQNQDDAILSNFERALPYLSDEEKNRLMWFGEGLAFAAEQKALETGKTQEVTE